MRVIYVRLHINLNYTYFPEHMYNADHYITAPTHITLSELKRRIEHKLENQEKPYFGVYDNGTTPVLIMAFRGKLYGGRYNSCNDKLRDIGIIKDGTIHIFAEHYVECSICLEEVVPTRRDVCRLKCGHVYHTLCLYDWIIGNSKNTCPTCCSAVNKSALNKLTRYTPT